MAAIYKSTGGVGNGSTDPGLAIPLDVIADRLRGNACVYLGRRPRVIEPIHQYWTYIVIEVAPQDQPVGPFTQWGFHFVADLTVDTAGFLFAPPT